MPLINTHEVIDRHNRPQVEQKVMLRTFFVNDGSYADPYAISSVHVFKRPQNQSPNTVLNDSGIVASSQTNQAAMVFGVNGDGETSRDISFSEGNYTGEVAPFLDGSEIRCSGVSGIYRLGRGEYACVLDGMAASSLSGTDQNGDSIMNTASFSTDYIDIWTVKMTGGSHWSTYINSFELFDDTFFTLTERLMLRTKNTLINKQVILGSITDLKVTTEVTVENRNLPEELRNIFKDSVIRNPNVTLVKHNEDSDQAARVVIKKDDPGAFITANDTLVYSLDTTTMFTGLEDLIGSRSGTYSLQVSYNVLAEKIVSPLMYFLIK
mgnify:CR=1 FL=1